MLVLNSKQRVFKIMKWNSAVRHYFFYGINFLEQKHYICKVLVNTGIRHYGQQESG